MKACLAQKPWLSIGSASQVIPAALFLLISNNGSLTAQMRRCCRVGLVRQVRKAGWQTLTEEEYAWLSLPRGSQHWVREVDHCDGETLLVSSRAVIPAELIQRSGDTFTALGTGTLGAVLFSNMPASRSAFVFQSLRTFNGVDLAAPCWARRSEMVFEATPILITELFNPAFYNAASYDA